MPPCTVACEPGKSSFARARLASASSESANPPAPNHGERTSAPFSIAPDPAFLYLSDGHREALAHLMYGFSHGGFVLITMDTSTTFSPDLVAFTACDPQGPFENRTLLYRTPESGVENQITYNAHAHPQFADERGWLVSYNVNSRTFADLFLDAGIYRPRFIRVPFQEAVTEQ